MLNKVDIMTITPHERKSVSKLEGCKSKSLGAPEFCRIFDPLGAEYPNRTDTTISFILLMFILYGVNFFRLRKKATPYKKCFVYLIKFIHNIVL